MHDIVKVNKGDSVKFWVPRMLGVIGKGTVQAIGHKYITIGVTYPAMFAVKVWPSDVTENVTTGEFADLSKR